MAVPANGFSQIDNRDIVDLDPHEILVVLGLKAYFRSSPTQEELAQTIGISVASVRRAIKSLIAKRRLSIIRVGRKGVGANRYILLESGGHTDRLTSDGDRKSGGHSDLHKKMTTTNHSEEDQTPAPAAREEEAQVPLGELPPDEEPDEPRGLAHTFKSCEALFVRRAKQAGQPHFPIGAVRKAIQSLKRDKGLDYAQIAEVIETFFVRYAAEARNATNVAALFRYKSGEILNFRKTQAAIRGTDDDDKSWRSDTGRRADQALAEVAAQMREKYGW